MLWRDQLTHFIGKEEVERPDKKLKSLNVSGLDDHRIEYGQMFRYSTESIQEVVRDVASWSKDPYELVLLANMILFNPDQLSLIKYSETQHIQNKFAILLYKYLNKKHINEAGVSVSRFAGAVNVVTKCKDLYHMRLKQMK